MAVISGSMLQGHGVHLYQVSWLRDPRTLGIQGSGPWRTVHQHAARSPAFGGSHRCSSAVLSGAEPARISNLRVESRGLTFTLPVDYAQVPCNMQHSKVMVAGVA
jgi:hypothetical protein